MDGKGSMSVHVEYEYWAGSEHRKFSFDARDVQHGTGNGPEMVERFITALVAGDSATWTVDVTPELQQRGIAGPA